MEELITSEVEELKKRDEIKAVFIVGSYARNPDAEHNDIDFLVIVEGEERWRKTEEVQNIIVEKFFNTEEWIEKYLSSEQDKWYVVQWLENADLRYDPDNLIEELREKAEEKIQQFKEEDLDEEEVLYYIWDYLQDIESAQNIGQKRYIMYNLFDYIIKKHYRKENELPVKYNYMVKNLENFDGYMYKLAQEFLNSSSTMEKERKIKDMIDHFTKEMGDPSPEYSSEKEKI